MDRWWWKFSDDQMAILIIFFEIWSFFQIILKLANEKWWWSTFFGNFSYFFEILIVSWNLDDRFSMKHVEFRLTNVNFDKFRILTGSYDGKQWADEQNDGENSQTNSIIKKIDPKMLCNLSTRVHLLCSLSLHSNAANLFTHFVSLDITLALALTLPQSLAKKSNFSKMLARRELLTRFWCDFLVLRLKSEG